MFLQNLKQCKIARQHKQRNDCNSDWCAFCSKHRTNWLTTEINQFTNTQEQSYFTTILLKPRATTNEMIQDADNALKLLSILGVECIGAFQVATNHNTKDNTWSNFAHSAGYLPGLHKGIGHLHIITKKPCRHILLHHFPLKQQIKEIMIGTGHYAKKTLKE